MAVVVAAVTMGVVKRSGVWIGVRSGVRIGVCRAARIGVRSAMRAVCPARRRGSTASG